MKLFVNAIVGAFVVVASAQFVFAAETKWDAKVTLYKKKSVSKGEIKTLELKHTDVYSLVDAGDDKCMIGRVLEGEKDETRVVVCYYGKQKFSATMRCPSILGTDRSYEAKVFDKENLPLADITVTCKLGKEVP